MITLSDEPEDDYQISYLTTIGKYSDMLYFRETEAGIEIKRAPGQDGTITQAKMESLGTIPRVR